MNDNAFIACLCVLSSLLVGSGVYLIGVSFISIVGGVVTMRRRQLEILDKSLDQANAAGGVALSDVVSAAESALT